MTTRMALRTKLSSLALAALVGLSAFSASVRAVDQRFVTIGTGGVTGVYYPAGEAICRLVNRSRDEHGIRCSVESTGGSIYNLNAIREGKLDLVVVQSDWQSHAYNGTGQFRKDGPDKKLRAVFSLHQEPFTVVARKGAGIKNFRDLKGKRVSIGGLGSGQHATAKVLMDAMGWTRSDFSESVELKASEQSRALCDNRIDAFFYAVGNPSGAIKQATTSCDSVLVNVDNAASRKLVADNPYYRKAIIPGGMYRGNDKDTITFGVSATLVSSSDVDADVIYQIVKAVFENFDKFRRLHPAFENLTKKEMVSGALSAPLHAGARRYYKEVGLIK